MPKEIQKPSKAATTRQRLLELALKKFNKDGFDQTSMRDLAAEAGLSLGAFYYHFKNKEEVVQVYYEGTLAVFAKGAEKIFAETKDFEERLIRTLELRMRTFQENRELLVALSKAAVDPRSELSPFGAGQKKIREQTIEVFQTLIEGSDLKYNKKLEPVLPMLLWLYLMAIVFLWVYDESKNQTKTFKIIDQLTPLICRLIRFSRVPLSGRVIAPIIDAIETVTSKS